LSLSGPGNPSYRLEHGRPNAARNVAMRELTSTISRRSATRCLVTMCERIFWANKSSVRSTWGEISIDRFDMHSPFPKAWGDSVFRRVSRANARTSSPLGYASSRLSLSGPGSSPYRLAETRLHHQRLWPSIRVKLTMNRPLNGTLRRRKLNAPSWFLG
jgi:hypothetical protein